MAASPTPLQPLSHRRHKATTAEWRLLSIYTPLLDDDIALFKQLFMLTSHYAISTEPFSQQHQQEVYD